MPARHFPIHGCWNLQTRPEVVPFIMTVPISITYLNSDIRAHDTCNFKKFIRLVLIFRAWSISDTSYSSSHTVYIWARLFNFSQYGRCTSLYLYNESDLISFGLGHFSRLPIKPLSHIHTFFIRT